MVKRDARRVPPPPGLKVAVLIPLYNHERYIGAAMDSLRAQTRPPDRIIVLDDGSTDGSLGAMMAYAAARPAADGPAQAAGIEPRIEVLFQPNAGAHAALNRLVSLVEDCEYLAILNSDDRYHPRRLERCLEHLDAHPEVGLLCTRLRLIDEAGDALPSDAPRARWFSAAWSFGVGTDDTSALDLAEWLGLANFPGTTSNFVARTDFLRARPFANYRFAHDYHALVHAALDRRFAVLNAELLDYRVHAANTISTAPERLIREMLRLNLDLARELGPRLPVEPDLRATFARYLRASWSNVSAFRADLFQLVLTEALTLLPSQAVDALLAELDAARFPEVTQFPNRAIVNTHQENAPALGPTSGLADKFYALKAQLSAVRADQRPWTEHRQLQGALLASRWFSLGRMLGTRGGDHASRRQDRAGESDDPAGAGGQEPVAAVGAAAGGAVGEEAAGARAADPRASSLYFFPKTRARKPPRSIADPRETSRRRYRRRFT